MRAFLDACIAELDAALRVFGAQAGVGGRPAPATPAGAERPDLRGEPAREAARLMRINHAGEVAAQALYRGQAVVARDEALRARLRIAAAEERDHLAWCEQRISELGGRRSMLTPLWYGGSFVIGALAGLTGDRISLGFLAETEKQVVEHLAGHLARLPAEDARSRSIVLQMQRDEAAHQANALEHGGIELPRPIRAAMRATARIMTTVAYRV